jgi:hypothetical protein
VHFSAYHSEWASLPEKLMNIYILPHFLPF